MTGTAATVVVRDSEVRTETGSERDGETAQVITLAGLSPHSEAPGEPTRPRDHVGALRARAGPRTDAHWCRPGSGRRYGELTQHLPFDMVDAALSATRTTQARLRDLPSRVVVYVLLVSRLKRSLNH